MSTPTPHTVRPETDERLRETGEGDHDRFAHYVRKRELEKARRTGKPVTALCGKRWVPDRDPSRYPMCQTCADIVAESFSRGLQ
jgi:hypothetical protein